MQTVVQFILELYSIFQSVTVNVWELINDSKTIIMGIPFSPFPLVPCIIIVHI